MVAGRSHSEGPRRRGRSPLVLGWQKCLLRWRGPRRILIMGKKIGLLTGGGDCPGLNPALRGVVMRGLDHGFEFVGFLEGWRGLVEGNTQPVTLEDVKELVGKGGTFLGSSRTNPFKKEGAVDK